MLGHGSVLRLHLSEAAQGGYTCEAAVPGFPKLATSYQVSLRGPPEIEAAAEQKLAEVGASTTVACEVRNQGPASWSRGAAWLARVAAAVARVSMVPLSRGPGDCAQLPAPAAADTGVIDPDTGTGTHRPAPPGEISTIC